MSNLPVPPRIDRAALERIMQRAAELQAGERDIGEGLTEQEVLDLGKEVGIPGAYLQQAMLEEKSRLGEPESRSLLGHLVGPGEVSASRVIRGEVEDVEASILHWMEKHELLIVQRQLPGRITWEPMGGMQAAIRRGTAALNSKSTKFMLDRADLVAASVAPLEPGYCHVTLSGRVRSTRSGFIGGAVTLVGAGAVGSALLIGVGIGGILPVAPVVVLSACVWPVLRSFRPIVARVQLGLERALDHLERGGVKPAHALEPRNPGIVEQIAGEIRKALQSASTPSRRRP